MREYVYFVLETWILASFAQKTPVGDTAHVSNTLHHEGSAHERRLCQIRVFPQV